MVFCYLSTYFVRAETADRHRAGASESSAHSVINTSGTSPGGSKLTEVLRLETDEMFVSFLDDLLMGN